jgi:hypothetical protein
MVVRIREEDAMIPLLTVCLLIGLTVWMAGGAGSAGGADDEPWVVYEGGEGAGASRSVVLISGDEEYRSEESLPQLGRILAARHGFRATVLFAIDPETGEIDPNNQNNIPGLEALDTADLMIIATRFRDLPDEQMKHVDAYLNSGKPILGMRTATHAFNVKTDDGEAAKKYAHYDFRSEQDGWDGGFGRQVLGETWINHHGHHQFESTRGLPAPGQEENPILNGCEDIWGPTDVYTVRLPLPDGCEPVLMGQVLEGMDPGDKPLGGAPRAHEKNDPMMPVAWTTSYTGPAGRTARVFTSTMGSSTDLASEGMRRLLVNACYWCVGLGDSIPPRANVDVVGAYEPTAYGFGTFVTGVWPADLRE